MNSEKKDLIHKLHIQHRNTKHDIIEIISKYFAEIESHNEDLIKKFSTPTIWNDKGEPIKVGTFNDYGFLNSKKLANVDELSRLIMNVKQRKPKNNE